MSVSSITSQRKKIASVSSAFNTHRSEKRYTHNLNENPIRPIIKSSKCVRFNLAENVSRPSKVKKCDKAPQENKPTVSEIPITTTKMKETVVAMQKLHLSDNASSTPRIVAKVKVPIADGFRKVYYVKEETFLPPNKAKALEDVLRKDVVVKKEVSKAHHIKEENEVSKVKRFKMAENYFKEKTVILSKGSKENRIKILEEVSKTQPKDIFIRYSLPVRIGEWYDSLCQFDSKVEAIDAKFTQGLNFRQQKEVVLQYLQEPIDLGDSDPYLRYNCAVHITSYKEYSILEPCGKLVLSTLVTEDQIVHGGPLCIASESQVTLSKDLRQLRRNVFCFVSCNYSNNTIEKDEPISVNYQESVYIRLFSRGTNKPLYLRCEIPNTDYFGENKDRFLLRVTETLDNYCKFQIQSLNHLKRRWKVREPVPSFEKVLICHTMSNRLLAVDQYLINDSLIVGREIKACCFKYKLNYDFIPSETLWNIKTYKS